MVSSVRANSVRPADDKRDCPGPVGGDAVVRDRAAAVLRVCVQGRARPTVSTGVGPVLDYGLLFAERGPVLRKCVQSS